MAHPQHQPRRKRRKSWLGRTLFWLACVVVVLVVAVVIATPWILRAAVPDLFARFGLQATVTGGSLNLVRREITLEGFVLGAPGESALSLGELGVGLDVRDLIRGRIKLRHLRVRDVKMDAERLLALREKFGAGTGPRQGSLPVELAELDLQDIRLVSTGERIGHDVRIERLKVTDLSALAAQRSSSVSLQSTVGDGSVDLQLELSIDQGNLQATGTYRVEALPLRGWARLGSGDDDPLSAGAVNGRGDVRTQYALEARKLDLTLDGRVSFAGLGMDTETLQAESGNADWQGRLVLGWSPDMAMPELRGDGSLDVEKLTVMIGRSSPAPVHAAIDDMSWHGNFEFREQFTAEGAVLGTRVDVSDASTAEPAWRAHAEDFSWRLNARSEPDPESFSVRMQDFDLAKLSVSASNDGAPLDMVVEELVIDELRSAQSGNLVLGQATADTLTVTRAGGTGSSDDVTINVNALSANGVSGDTAGTLHIAKVNAESLDYTQADRRVRAEEIDFASVGLSAPAWVGADELNIKSARVDGGREDIWLSGLKATRMHGDSSGRFGAEGADVTHMFQSAAAEVSWEASGLRLRGIDGDAHDSARISTIDLGELKVGIADTSWEGSGLHTARVAVTMKGDLDVGRLGFASLERRQASSGDLRISKLDGRGFRSHDARGALDTVTAASLEYRLPDGVEIATHGLEARTLTGDPSTGLEVEHFSVERGDGRDLHGARVSASALATGGLSVASDGSIAIEKVQLGRFSRTATDTARLDLEGLDVASLSWAPGGGLSTLSVALGTARLAHSDGLGWVVTKIATHKLAWDGGSDISADHATLASVSQTRGEIRNWLVQSLRAAGLQLTLPGDVAVAAATADSIDGGTGAPAWTVASIAVEGFSSTESAGQKVHRLTSGAVKVTDERNRAVLSVEHTQAKTVEMSVLRELAAQKVIVGRLHLGSDDPDWPSRLSMAELRIDEPLLRVGGIVDLGEIVARNPYLIVGQSADNAWLLPPLPGGGSDAGGGAQGNSTGGIRVGRFTTQGPGRVVYIDRATEPVFQLAFDPVVVAIQNLDTGLPGNRSRFRVRATSSRFADLTLDGDLIKGVQGFDLALEAHVTGAYLPVLNPYVARHEPIAVTSGWGDAHNEIKIENGQLNGRVDLLLSGLQVRKTVGGTTLPRITPANLTLSTALALLRDGQGNISLSIPLRAQTEDPEYDFVDTFQQDFVRTVKTSGRVAASVSERTLDGAVQLIESTISVLPGVDTTRYPPIAFEPGSDDVSARHLEALNQPGDRLLKYDSLVLALCGRAVTGDSESIAGKASGIDKLFDRASEGVFQIYAPGREGMLALAGARADTVRRYLRDLRGVPDKQLAPCDPHFDATSEASPRVELEVKSPAKRRGLFGLFP